jgi:hypothetical protein
MMRADWHTVPLHFWFTILLSSSLSLLYSYLLLLCVALQFALLSPLAAFPRDALSRCFHRHSCIIDSHTSTERHS